MTKKALPTIAWAFGHQHLLLSVEITSMFPESDARVDRLYMAVRDAIENIPRETWGLSPHAGDARVKQQEWADELTRSAATRRST